MRMERVEKNGVRREKVEAGEGGLGGRDRGQESKRVKSLKSG